MVKAGRRQRATERRATARERWRQARTRDAKVTAKGARNQDTVNPYRYATRDRTDRTTHPKHDTRHDEPTKNGRAGATDEHEGGRLRRGDIEGVDGAAADC